MIRQFAMLALVCGILGISARAETLDDALKSAKAKCASQDFDERKKGQQEMIEVSQRFLATLAEGLSSDDLEIRKSTEAVLKQLDGVLKLTRITLGLPPADQAAVKDLQAKNPELFERMTSNDSRQRAKSIAALLEAKAPPGLLISLTRDSDDQVRRRATRALGKLGNPAALPRLKELADFTEEPAETNNGNFAHSFVMMGGAGAGNADGPENLETRRIAIAAIGALKNADGAQFLVSRLKSATGTDSLDTLKALKDSGQDAVAVPALMTLIDSTVTPLARNANGVRMSTAMSINGKAVNPDKITLGTFAIVALCGVTGQNEKDYGVEATGSDMFNDVNYYSFIAGGSQEKAVEALKKWFDESKYKKK